MTAISKQRVFKKMKESLHLFQKKKKISKRKPESILAITIENVFVMSKQNKIFVTACPINTLNHRIKRLRDPKVKSQIMDIFRINAFKKKKSNSSSQSNKCPC